MGLYILMSDPMATVSHARNSALVCFAYVCHRVVFPWKRHSNSRSMEILVAYMSSSTQAKTQSASPLSSPYGSAVEEESCGLIVGLFVNCELVVIIRRII
jgi:hypothetical protein